MVHDLHVPYSNQTVERERYVMEYAIVNTIDNNTILDIIKDTLEVCMMVAETINALVGEDAVVCVLVQVV